MAQTTGWDEAASRAWLSGGTNESSYELPWRLAAVIAAEEAPSEAEVLDVASGPGGFLEVALATIPGSQGVWLDNFEAMESEARERFASLGLEGRVRYRRGDLLDLANQVEAGSTYLVTCSRATHHLDAPALGDFYRQAFDALRPGGWLANLDQVASPEPWAHRLSAARRQLTGGGGTRVPGHPAGHSHSLDDHLGAIGLAGFADARPVWMFCQHVLVMAQKGE